MVCVTLVLLSCDCYLYVTEAAAAGPLDESFVLQLEEERVGEERGVRGKQKQMSLLDYHLSPCGRTLSSCLVCVSSAGVGVCPPLPGTENSKLISQYHWY